MHTAIELYLSIALAYCLIHLVWSFVIRDAFDDMKTVFQEDIDGWNKLPAFAKRVTFLLSVTLFMGELLLHSAL